MSISTDKLMHFVIGAVTGWSYWIFLDRYAKTGIRYLNPLIFLLGVIWGASGLFFFRQLQVPILEGQFFYMAIPDWDLPLYKITKFSFLLHRSWLFHSVLLPVGLLTMSLIGMSQKQIFTISSWLRDAAIALCVGISAHLIWDALLSETKRGFFIRGWSHSDSLIWLAVNLAIGFGLPLICLKSLRETQPKELD
ncbi:MAG: hypothetical protein AAGA60_01795 [Cyanobacteria bacterium P01_E01_bin.42]